MNQIAPSMNGERPGAMRALSLLMERYQLATQLNLRFAGGKQRDIYEAAGYDKQVTYQQYLLRYMRQDVARRIVNVVADDCWRLPPELLDGDDPDTAKDDTEFADAWLRLAEGQAEEAETRRGLLHYLHRLDKVTGIGRYGVLFLGLRDERDPKEEVEGGKLDEAGLLFASVYDEASASVVTWDTNKQSPRYGRPLLYQLTERTDAGTQVTFQAHWTRCIHVADNVLTSDLVGTPRLEGVWNRLIDLDKLAAATGEAGWRLMQPGYVFSTKDGYELGNGPEAKSSEDEIDEFVHELRRHLELEGMDAQELGGQLQDPSGAVTVILKLISAGTGIPLRKLTGSEMGQLASAQDDDNWTDVVEARQQQHVTPAIIRPVVNRLLWLGVLPAPASGDYTVWWPSQREKSPKEQAEIADRAASALQKVKAKVKPQLFAQTYLPDLPAAAVEEEPQEPPPNPLLPSGADVGDQPAADAEDPEQNANAQAGEGGTPATNAGRFRWPQYYP